MVLYLLACSLPSFWFIQCIALVSKTCSASDDFDSSFPSARVSVEYCIAQNPKVLGCKFVYLICCCVWGTRLPFPLAEKGRARTCMFPGWTFVRLTGGLFVLEGSWHCCCFRSNVVPADTHVTTRATVLVFHAAGDIHGRMSTSRAGVRVALECRSIFSDWDWVNA